MKSKAEFPHVAIAETMVFRPFNPSGLFQYRYMQAMRLLEPRSLLGDKWSSEPIEQFVAMQRPLAALVLFLNVVALEDFLRQLGQRLAGTAGLQDLFPDILRLASVAVPAQPKKPNAKRDRDPFTLFDLHALNRNYSSVLGIEPLSTTNFPRLEDLILLRHTVAHHGSLVRAIDVPRFQYYNMVADRVINPPVSFVRDESAFIYKRMREFETAVLHKVLAGLIPTLLSGWRESPPRILLELVETFNYFDKVLPQAENVPTTDQFAIGDAYFREQSRLSQLKLEKMCIETIATKFS